jgi:ELWxxDGT repeat protein
VVAPAGHDALLGGAGHDTLFRGPGNDSLFVGAERDTLLGEAGDDWLAGGAGEDSLQGGECKDRLWADPGDDGLAGGAGADAIVGNAGDDRLEGGAGDDRLERRDGHDLAVYAGRAAGYALEFGVEDHRRVVVLRDTDASDGDDGTDTITGVERLRFADRTTAVPARDPAVPGFLFLGRGDATQPPAIWVSDGTEAGTPPAPTLADPDWTGAAHSLPWTALGDGRALVTGGDADSALAVWSTDGTAAGTHLLAAVPYRGSPDPLIWPKGAGALGDGHGLFAAGGDETGQELWVTDGRAAGTRLLRDITPGATGSAPGQWTPLGDGRALFVAWRHPRGADRARRDGAGGRAWHPWQVKRVLATPTASRDGAASPFAERGGDPVVGSA